MDRQGIIISIRNTAASVMPKGSRLILFGSQARGDARDGSDWDLLILLNRTERIGNADFDRYAYPLVYLGWSLDVVINPILYTEKEWHDRRITPFYQNVENEGILIWEWNELSTMMADSVQSLS